MNKKGDPIKAIENLNKKLLADRSADKFDKMKVERDYFKREYNKLNKRHTITSDIVKSIQEIVVALPPVKCKALDLSSKGKYKGTHLQLISDCHAGQLVLKEHTAGLTEYNFDIFTKRTERLFNKIVQIKKIDSTSHNIDKIVVAFMGDLVHGQKNAGKWANWGFDPKAHIVYQALKAGEIFAWGLMELAKKYKTVEVIFIPGNHGRVGKTDDEPKVASWDIVAMEHIRLKVQNQKNIKFKQECFNWNAFIIHKIEKMKFLFIHGDAARSSGGIPFRGLAKEKDRIRTLAEYVGESFDHIAVGHFHQDSMLSEGNGYLFVNGAMVTGDSYTVERLHVARPASQTLILLSGNKIANYRPLILQEKFTGTFTV